MQQQAPSLNMSVRLLGDQEGDPQFPTETNETKREIQEKP
jgi:hypothetical protein